MGTKIRVALLTAMVAGSLLTTVGLADAHQCGDKPQKKDNCHETPVYEDWRNNYVPLFDLADRDGEDGEQQRRDAQRWREECSNDGEERQQCAWAYGGTSAAPIADGLEPYPTDPATGPRPNELHVGYAANHCFLAEQAHDCDSHKETEFGTHDSHGGALYADVCISENPDSRRCDDGATDTQAGVTIVDHLECPGGCSDEYHIVRPLDQAYTTRQMEDSAAAAGTIAADPQRHLCGYPEHSSC
jgi:hypothetical protein